jgi:hypothetical protein
MLRKRENERLKKEKADQIKERERLKAEIARDKEIRRKNKGVLPSVLGVEGYNPPVAQYDVDLKEGEIPASTSSTAAGGSTVPAKRSSSEQQQSSSKCRFSLSFLLFLFLFQLLLNLLPLRLFLLLLQQGKQLRKMRLPQLLHLQYHQRKELIMLLQPFPVIVPLVMVVLH